MASIRPPGWTTLLVRFHGFSQRQLKGTDLLKTSLWSPGKTTINPLRLLPFLLMTLLFFPLPRCHGQPVKWVENTFEDFAGGRLDGSV